MKIRQLSTVAIVLLIAAIFVAGCETTQSRFAPLDGKTYPPKDASFEVEVFETGLPSCSFERIARLDVHLEKSGFMQSTLEEAMPQLHLQARAAGADAIIEIREQRSSVNETRILHVTATGIRYND